MLRFTQLILLAACLLGCMTGDASAQDAPSENKKDSTAQTEQQPSQIEEESLEALKEYKAKSRIKFLEYTKRYRAATTRAEKSAVVKTRPDVKNDRDKIADLISKSPAASKEAQKITNWWYNIERNGSGAKVALEVILAKYSKTEFMDEHVYKLPLKFSKMEAEKHLRSLIDISPFDSVKAKAIYHLSKVLSGSAEELEGEKSAMVKEEIESLTDLLNTKYADAVDISGIKISELLAAEAFASKLEIGQPVPDIVGSDLDGVEFKLSDYQGKVTMISFWGNW